MDGLLEYDRISHFLFGGQVLVKIFKVRFLLFVLWWIFCVLKIKAVHLVDHHHLGSPWHYRHEI